MEDLKAVSCNVCLKSGLEDGVLAKAVLIELTSWFLIPRREGEEHLVLTVCTMRMQ